MRPQTESGAGGPGGGTAPSPQKNPTLMILSKCIRYIEALGLGHSAVNPVHMARMRLLDEGYDIGIDIAQDVADGPHGFSGPNEHFAEHLGAGLRLEVQYVDCQSCGQQIHIPSKIYVHQLDTSEDFSTSAVFALNCGSCNASHNYSVPVAP